MAKKLAKMETVERLEQGLPLNTAIGKDESAKMIESTRSALNQDMPQQTRRIISLCPIAKVFQPYTNIDRFIEDLKEIYIEESFKIILEASWATREFNYGEAYVVKESDALMLVGIDNDRFENSTGATGFVYFDAPDDIIAAFNYAKKTKKAVDPDLQKELDLYIGRARELSKKRVMNYMKHLYNGMMLGRQTIAEHGAKNSAPTDYEMLVSSILAEETLKRNNKRQALRKQWEEAQAIIQGKDEF